MRLARLSKKTGSSRKYAGRRAVRWLSVFGPLILIFIFCICAVLIIYRSQYFKIQNIEITGAGGYVNEIDLKEVVRNISYDRNLITYDIDGAKQILKDNFQGARGFEIKRKLPDTLVVDVVERVPLVVVYNDNSSLFLVDEDGYVLGIVDESTTNLPKVYYEGDIKVGYFVDPGLISVFLEVLNAMDQEKLLASSVSVHKRYIRLFLADSIEVYIGNDKEKHETVKLLALLLKQLSAEGKNVKKVDLRYDKVIVSYD
jgi:cell division septal protein FtsQ